MSKSLLEEALEDAKLLKETAIENAKNVLVEAISPKIQEFVDGQLGGIDAVNEMPAYEDEDEMEDEAFAFEAKDDDEDDDYKMDEKKHDDDDDDYKMDEAKDEDEEMDEVVEITNEDLQQALSELIGNSQGLSEAQVSSGFADEQNPNTNATGGLGEKSAPGERGLEDKEKEEMWKDHEPPASEDWTVKEARYRKYIESLVKQNHVLKVENNQFKKVTGILRRNINEVNLFNSKLLYTNKLIQSINLDSKQRTGVIEQFDRAQSLREVELIYKSLSESFKIAGVLGEGRKNKKPRSSRPAASGGTSRLLDEQVNRSEGKETFSEHMQRLAGIVD